MIRTSEKGQNPRRAGLTEPVYRRLAFMLCICLLLGLPGVAGCDWDNRIAFPTLGTTAATTNGGTVVTEQTTGPTGTGNEILTLTLAVPFGQDAAEALRLLFLARQSGLLVQEKGQFIGQLVQVDELQQFDGPLRFNLETVSANAGASDEQIKGWRAAGTLPDLIYCQDAAASLGLDQILDLQTWLFDQVLLSPGHVYPAAVDSVRIGQAIYGVPFLASAPMVYFNQALLDQYQTAAPPLEWSWADWLLLLQKLQQAVSQVGQGATPADLAAFADQPDALRTHLRQAVFLVEDLTGFLPFLPATLAADAGWAMWNGRSFSLSDPSFRTAAEWLRLQAKAGYSLLHLTADQRLAALNPATARQQGRIILWIGNSTDLAYWHQLSGIMVSESLMPAGPIQDNPDSGGNAVSGSILALRTPIQVRSLVVSQASRYPELAAQLAAFLALDIDALLLQSRFQLYEGLFPLVQEPMAWNALVARQPYGGKLMAIKDNLPYAYCSSSQIVAAWQTVLDQAISRQGEAYLSASDSADLNGLLAQINSEAQTIMRED